MDEEDSELKKVVTCSKCGWVGELSLCPTDFTTYNTVNETVEVLQFLCPDCNEVVDEQQEEVFTVGPAYGDYNPDHAGWDAGDYGDYGGE